MQHTCKTEVVGIPWGRDRCSAGAGGRCLETGELENLPTASFPHRNVGKGGVGDKKSIKATPPHSHTHDVWGKLGY